MAWLPDKLWARILVIGAYFVIGYCLLRASGIILPALAPFIVAWIAAALLQKPISRISSATAVSRKIISVTVTAFFLFVLSFIAFLISRRLLSEAGRLVSVIGEKSGDVIEKISDFISGNADKLSVGIFGDKITNKMITDGITDSISSVIASASSKVASFFASLVSSVPEILLFTAMSLT